jgi:hypothetical protein
MDPDVDPQARDGRPADLPSVRDHALSWLQAPLTIRHLCGLGIIVVGSGIPVALMGGGWVGLWLAGMVIVIIAMAMAHDGDWTRKRRRPARSALKRTRVRRRPARGARRTRKRGGGERSLEARGEPEPPRLGEGRVSPDPTDARQREPTRGKVRSRKAAKKRDRR